MKIQNLAAVFGSFFVTSLTPTLADHDHEYANLTWAVLDTSLPKALSDHTASLAQNGLVYIAGGCDAPDGNVWDESAKLFFCTSISDTFYSFDPQSSSFTTLTDMPRARYRHAGIAVNNQVWLVGGRDVDDALVGQVDVYDIGTGEWSTFTDLPESYWLSDLTGFASPDTELYVVGGFDITYNASSLAYRINPEASTENGSLDIVPIPDLGTARGDIPSTVDVDGNYAYVGGGFSHENGFCEPLGNVDRYEFATGTWQALDPLPTPRADKVLVELNGHLFAIGGERQIEGYCELAEDTPDMGELTIAVDDVEVWDGDHWSTVMSLPEHRFRFAAVGIDNAVYTFGGQQAFENSCQCMRTASEIVTYSEESSGESSHANVLPIMFNWLVVLSSLFMVCLY